MIVVVGLHHSVIIEKLEELGPGGGVARAVDLQYSATAKRAMALGRMQLKKELALAVRWVEL